MYILTKYNNIIFWFRVILIIQIIYIRKNIPCCFMNENVCKLIFGTNSKLVLGVCLEAWISATLICILFNYLVLVMAETDCSKLKV